MKFNFQKAAAEESFSLSFFAVLICTLAPFFDFYSANVNERVELYRLFNVWWMVVVTLVIAIALIRVMLPKTKIWKLATILLIALWLFNSYYLIKPHITLQQEAHYLSKYYMAAIVVICLVGYLLVRYKAVLLFMLFAAIGSIISSAWSISVNITTTSELKVTTSSALDLKLVAKPNIYWIILDSYPGKSVLQDFFTYNNDEFYQLLEDKGFNVAYDTLATHPSSIYSVATTLSMSHILDETTSLEKGRDLGSLRTIIKGKNPLVKSLKAQGYTYVHFANGYDFMTLCGPDMDRCVEGNKGFDEVSLALLQRTPVIDYLLLDTSVTEVPEGDAFDWGGVNELNLMLDDIMDTPSPHFAYAHIISPHPPMRFDANCDRRAFFPDLKTWNFEMKDDFIEQLKCVNTRIEETMERIIDRDENAVIIIQSDHGAAFQKQFVTAPEDWTESQFFERFSVLDAIRMPQGCDEHLDGRLNLINTFPRVLNCLSKQKIQLLEDQNFISLYDNHQDFGKVFKTSYPQQKKQSAN